jgi:transposase
MGIGAALAASDTVKQYIDRLENENRQLKESLERNILQFTQQIKSLEAENERLQEKLKLALFRQFGKAAERFDGAGQPQLFDSEEAGAPRKDTEPVETETIQYTRTKTGGRKPIDPKIPREEVIIDLPEAEKQCACGKPLVCIGEDAVERLVLIPEQVYVVRYLVKKYACHACEGSGDEDKPAVRSGKVPASLMPGSIATPELLGYIFTKKYCDYTPYYRQEAAFERIGVDLSRQTMNNWQLRTTEKLQPLLALLPEHLRQGNVVQMDETPMRVMNEPGRENGRESRMWLARGGPPGQPVLWYAYQETREKKHIVELLSGFSGYLQSDGYSSYESATEKDLAGVVHVGCFAHVRRHFFEAKKITTKPGLADQALWHIQELYKEERRLREQLRGKTITVEQFAADRRESCAPKLAAFHEWLAAHNNAVPPTSKIGEAVAYALKQWPSLTRYLDDWQLTPDNNACERGIRPFVMGRKNWVMSGSPAGAASSCELYTLIETAKANNWNPVQYLTKVFQRAAKMSPGDDWNPLLPWNLPK